MITDDYEEEFNDEFDFEIEETEEEDDNASDPVIREDKIFNNSYYNGDKLKDPDEYEFSKKIAVSSDYSDNYLKDLYDYEEQLESKFILDIIFEFLQKDEVLSKYTIEPNQNSNVAKIKFSKEDINLIFSRINENLDIGAHGITFYSPIFILEVISSISSMEYRKIFDYLDTEIQELLLIELNKKYNFLDGKMHKKGIH
jgi:hypothetical protein